MSSTDQGGSPASSARPHGPPYTPHAAILGGIPTTSVDIPVSSVLIALFIISATLNMTIFQMNKRRGHKFLLSSLLFALSMARITANIMRIVWACYPNNIRIRIATTILANVGVVLLFVANLVLSQRILRAFHPRIGWSMPVKLIFRFLYTSVAAALIMVIVAITYSFYTLDMSKLTKIHDVQLVGVTFLAVLAFLPIPLIILTIIIPRSNTVEKFGAGRMRHKIYLVLFTSVLLCLGASFRAGVSYIQHPAGDTSWVYHRACFYCFSYVIELIVVFTYALSRFDRLFHVPDGSSGRGHYSNGVSDVEKTSESANIVVEEERY